MDRLARCLLVVLATLAMQRPADAAGPGPAEAAEKSTQPFFDTNSIQLQPAYTDVHDGGNNTQMLVRVAVVYPNVLIPGVRAWGI